MDKKIIEFQTLSDDSTKGLSVRVNYLLQKGWKLSGTMTTSGTGGSLLSSGSITYSQAMVLHEGELITLPTETEESFRKEIARYDGCMVYVIAGLGIALHIIFS